MFFLSFSMLHVAGMSFSTVLAMLRLWVPPSIGELFGPTGFTSICSPRASGFFSLTSGVSALTARVLSPEHDEQGSQPLNRNRDSKQSSRLALNIVSTLLKKSACGVAGAAV